jgi:very-short-patch-repair endonuclease
LAVEVDGGIHREPAQIERDRQRTEDLQGSGIRVLRFSNAEVENDLPGVLTRITEAARVPRISFGPNEASEGTRAAIDSAKRPVRSPLS